MNYSNIYTLFRERAQQYAGRECFYVRREGSWHGLTWDYFNQAAHELASALLAAGLERGASVCVLMGNVPEWPVADIGIIAAGGVSVGLYPTSSAEQCAYIINHSDAQFVITDTMAQLKKLLSACDGLPNVRAFIVLDENFTAERAENAEENLLNSLPSAFSASSAVISWREFLALGNANLNVRHNELRDRAENAQPDDTAIMVYTSGTTGLPKGARLSHRYVINSIESLRATIPIYDHDRAFSYLPYCHVAERIAGLYNRLYAGAPAYFVDDLAKLGAYMHEVKPTVFASLPRFFEKIHARIVSDLELAAPEVQQEFQVALEIGRRISRLNQTGHYLEPELLDAWENEAWPVFQRVRDYFGGHIRLLTSGGAPLVREIAEFFDAVGLTILQAYGLTENICAAFNRHEKHKFGTVGPPMPGCKIKIADDGEILLRSAMMFSGYHKAPAETAAMFRDGWLLTGDLGAVDADGFLRITGRKKELIITSTGKNVAPALVENLVKEHHLVSHAMLYGDGKSYLTALLTLNQAEAESYARAHGLEYDNFAALTRHPVLIELVDGIIAGVNARVSATESIKKYVLLDHDLSVEADEVTPTMKLKRNVVAKNYGTQLEALYQS